MSLGHVAQLFRYPVKSMLGEDLLSAEVTSSGFSGDREFALQDTLTGKIVSAKLPNPWRTMLQVRAAKEGDRVTATFPDGSRQEVVFGDFETRMSDHLGKRVRLLDNRAEGLALDRVDPDRLSWDGEAKLEDATVLEIGQAAPTAGFVDFAPIHIVLKSTLSKVATLTASGESDTARFRPNIVIEDTQAPDFNENAWTGRTLMIGDVALSIVTPTPRCAVPTLAHGELAPDPRLMARLGKENRLDIPEMGKLACLGAYAIVTSAGKIEVGDHVEWGPTN